MRPLTRSDLVTLLAERPGPCVSIYMPTDRSYPANKQGPIRYANAVRTAEEEMGRNYPGRDVRTIRERLHALIDDQYFWTHRFDGLAVFGAPNLFEIFDLHHKPADKIVVADSFHVKPLLRETQSADRFQVLCLQREKVWMLEGNRYDVEVLDLRGVPSTIHEALGGEIVIGGQAVGAHGAGTGGTHPAPDRPTVPHGHAAEGQDADQDTQRFFEVIDKAIWDKHSRPAGLPLLLAALPENQSLFRRLTKNPQLLPNGIGCNPAALSRQEMTTSAWAALQPFYLNRLARFAEDFQVARSRGQGSDDAKEISAAACTGRVGILLVDADQRVPGPRGTDALDDLAEAVLRTKGTVVVVPGERMPTRTGAAATYRY
jgi:hypothetical protein